METMNKITLEQLVKIYGSKRTAQLANFRIKMSELARKYKLAVNLNTIER